MIDYNKRVEDIYAKLEKPLGYSTCHVKSKKLVIGGIAGSTLLGAGIFTAGSMADVSGGGYGLSCVSITVALSSLSISCGKVLFTKLAHFLLPLANRSLPLTLKQAEQINIWCSHNSRLPAILGKWKASNPDNRLNASDYDRLTKAYEKLDRIAFETGELSMIFTQRPFVSEAPKPWSEQKITELYEQEIDKVWQKLEKTPAIKKVEFNFKRARTFSLAVSGIITVISSSLMPFSGLGVILIPAGILVGGLSVKRELFDYTVRRVMGIFRRGTEVDVCQQNFISDLSAGNHRVGKILKRWGQQGAITEAHYRKILAAHYKERDFVEKKRDALDIEKIMHETGIEVVNRKIRLTNIATSAQSEVAKAPQDPKAIEQTKRPRM